MALLAKKNNILLLFVAMFVFTSVAVLGVGGGVGAEIESESCPGGAVYYDADDFADTDEICTDPGDNCKGEESELHGEGTEDNPYQCCGIGANSICNPLNSPSLSDLFDRILEYLMFITGTLVVMAVVYGGILYIIGGADSSQIDKSKKTIKYAVIGFAIVLSAQGIVSLINILFS